MKRRVLLLVVLAAGLWGCTLPPSREVPVPFTTLAMGEHSRIRAATAVVVRNEKAWERLWRRHGGSAAERPVVDFRRDMVAAVFMGERPTAGYGLRVLDVHRASDGLHVLIRRRKPASGSLVAQVMTRPFVMIRLPASETPVHFDYTDTPGPR